MVSASVFRHFMNQRQVLGAHHPQRAAHREVLDQRAPLIRLGVQIGDSDAGQPCPPRQVRGGRVGGMQPHEVRCGAGDRVRGPVWAQEVPPRSGGRAARRPRSCAPTACACPCRRGKGLPGAVVGRDAIHPGGQQGVYQAVSAGWLHGACGVGGAVVGLESRRWAPG
jgi:hypothetical protein